MRTATCVDCNADIPVPPTGPLPKRCRLCAHERDKAQKRDRAARVTAQRQADRPAEVPCTDCGTLVPWSGRGRPKVRCEACLPEWTKEDARRRSSEWRQVNLEYARASEKVRYRKSEQKIRARKLAQHYQRNHNLTQEERDQLVAAQGGVCLICKKPPNGIGHHARLHIDHCHKTGRRRGLLCGNCNTMIGLAAEDPQILLAAVEYLQKEQVNASH